MLSLLNASLAEAACAAFGDKLIGYIRRGIRSFTIDGAAITLPNQIEAACSDAAADVFVVTAG